VRAIMKSINAPLVILLFCIFHLLGCESISSSYRQNVVNLDQLYLDSAYPKSTSYFIESEEDIFALDEEMKSMVKHVLNPERDQIKKARLLLEYIFSSNHIAMSYDQGANVTAIEAFHGSKANCMSLTIMAYSLANEAGMSLNFQNIKVPEYWVRQGGHQLLMGHVNLLVKRKSYGPNSQIWAKNVLQIDFDPGAAKEYFDRHVISKQTIVAMFYNNKGAEALVRADYDLAYAYFKAATQIDPLYYSAWGNLGVLYKMNKYYDKAIKAYQYALELAPNDLNALENLALLFTTLDRADEAKAINNKLHVKRLSNPHYHALLANEASYKQDYKSAIKHLKKAIRLEGAFHEFHFDLAKVYFKTKQLKLAKTAMNKAIKLNNDVHIERKYNKKLNFINHASVRY